MRRSALLLVVVCVMGCGKKGPVATEDPHVLIRSLDEACIIAGAEMTVETLEYHSLEDNGEYWGREALMAAMELYKNEKDGKKADEAKAKLKKSIDAMQKTRESIWYQGKIVADLGDKLGAVSKRLNDAKDAVRPYAIAPINSLDGKKHTLPMNFAAKKASEAKDKSK